jgi:hypothetical protein
MRLQEVGGLADTDDVILDPEWYRALTTKQLAAYVRYLFIYMQEGVADWDLPAHADARPYWDGGTTPDGVKHKSIWARIIPAIKKIGASPGLWVSAHFSPSVYAVRMAQGKGVIEGRPELLCSSISSDVYQNHLDYFFDTFEHQFIAAQASITTRFNILKALGLPPDDHFFLVICDKTHVNASPFLRHGFASEANCQRAVRKYIARAVIDYEMRQPLYDELFEVRPEYGWLVPAHLKLAVAKFRQHWSRYA